jgi:hypothetical protein
MDCTDCTVIMLQVGQPRNLQDSWQGQIFPTSIMSSQGLGPQPVSYTIGSGGPSPRYSKWGVKLTTHPNLQLRLKTSGVIHPPHIFIVYTEILLHTICLHCVHRNFPSYNFVSLSLFVILSFMPHFSQCFTVFYLHVCFWCSHVSGILWCFQALC